MGAQPGDGLCCGPQCWAAADGGGGASLRAAPARRGWSIGPGQAAVGLRAHRGGGGHIVSHRGAAVKTIGSDAGVLSCLHVATCAISSSVRPLPISCVPPLLTAPQRSAQLLAVGDSLEVCVDFPVRQCLCLVLPPPSRPRHCLSMRTSGCCLPALRQGRRRAAGRLR